MKSPWSTDFVSKSKSASKEKELREQFDQNREAASAVYFAAVQKRIVMIREAFQSKSNKTWELVKNQKKKLSNRKSIKLWETVQIGGWVVKKSKKAQVSVGNSSKQAGAELGQAQ